MWISPSAWVWMPERSGPSSDGLPRNSPQMLIPSASCQWSRVVGASLAVAWRLSRARNTSSVPTTMIPTIRAG
jgi:hypothetical protein